MRKLIALVRLSRPTFLLGGLAGFALGAAVAADSHAHLSVGRYAIGQLVVTAFQLMTHFANDFYDRSGDTLAERTAFSGGSGVLVAGALRPSTALRAAVICAAIGLVAVGFLCASDGVAATIGIAIGAGAWTYSGPPLRLSAHGWGELDTALVVGILVPLEGYAVFTGSIDGGILSATIAPACAMLVMMIAVEWPDRSADLRAGKRNLVVRCSVPRISRLAAWGALLTMPALLVAQRSAPGVGLVFSLLLLPTAIGFARSIGDPGRCTSEIAARGVALFGLTTTYELLGFIALVPHFRP